MRTTSLMTIGTTFLLLGCAAAKTPPPPPPPDTRAYMLVTPPERLSVLELREALKALPRDGAPLPAASGEVQVDRGAVQDFYERLQAEDSAEERAELLVEQSIDRTAPVQDWIQVREFNSRERCETTNGELQEITREASSAVSYYDGMPLYELQFVFLEWSYRWARCVPVEDLRPV